MKPPVEPKILKGFRDFLPEVEIVRKSMIRKLETVFEQFGFLPIDTPVIEYAEILLGKSGGDTEKQIYTFRDQGERQVALRFDLTVPFARFLAQHRQELVLPFKRYHIAKAWRGEKPQEGRYREFMQCDFDIVGVDSASADLEILLAMYRCFKALQQENFRIHFSHRGVFNEFIAALGVEKESMEALRIIDKSRKIGPERTRAELESFLTKGQADKLITFIAPLDSIADRLERIEAAVGSSSPSLVRLKAIGAGLAELGIASSFTLDTSITRGLDYYTALVFETFIEGAEEIGSVCSGGRYDNLVAVFSAEKLSGIGASVGIDRLLAVLEATGQFPTGKGRIQIAIPVIDEELMGYYHKVADILRSENFSVEVFHQKQKLAAQFTLAEKKGIPFGLLAGGRERENNVLHIRDFSRRHNYENLTLPEAIVKLKELTSV